MLIAICICAFATGTVPKFLAIYEDQGPSLTSS
jgi:hypothetical protein